MRQKALDKQTELGRGWGAQRVVFGTVLVTSNCRVLVGIMVRVVEGRDVDRIRKQVQCAMREPRGEPSLSKGRLAGSPVGSGLASLHHAHWSW